MTTWDEGPRVGQRGKYITMLFEDGSVTVRKEGGGGVFLSAEDLCEIFKAQREKVRKSR